MDSLSTIQSLDLALRGGASLLQLFLAALLLREHGTNVAARLGAAFAIGAAAFVLASTPGFAGNSAWWRPPVIAVATGNSVVFWLFARAMFDDRFALRWWHALLWGVLAVVGFWNCFGLSLYPIAARSIGAALELTALAFAVLAIAQSLATWRNDLVEGRRRLRGLIVGAGAGYTVVNAVARLAFPQESALALPGLINATALCAITVIIAWYLIGESGRELFSAPRLIARPLESLDASVVVAIERVMNDAQAYREPNLTVGALATKLGLAEYKLRRAINQGMGYRNFNAFLNHYRLHHAKAALADAAKSRSSVLDIAMEAGFQSLGPFNRSFKSDTGLTPTEFRRRSTSHPASTPRAMADFKIG
jgi:AraC-like DNA-binding protein